MINTKVPPNKKLLTLDKKQAILIALVDKQIQHEEYLSKMYAQEIQALTYKRKSLSERLQNWDQNDLASHYMTTWDKGGFMANSRRLIKTNFGKILSKNQSKLDQSMFFNESPNKKTSFGKKISDSPIRRLQSSQYQNNKYGRTAQIQKKMSQSSLSSQRRYSKIEELQKQIAQLQGRIDQKSQKTLKLREDDQISKGLWAKIQQQHKLTENLLKKWKQIELKHRVKLDMDRKTQRIKQDIFKQQQGIKVIKIQNINRNKEIIRKGYTNKMLSIIAAYGGIRK